MGRPRATRYFNPRPPCGGRRFYARSHRSKQRNFNPRPPCGGRPAGAGVCPAVKAISTHALLAEGDAPVQHRRKILGDISTHALLAEGDFVLIITLQHSRFQPTPSLRRATTSEYDAGVEGVAFQPTPSLRRATIDDAIGQVRNKFQPTPSLRRATSLMDSGDVPILVFQPTPSLRRATHSNSVTLQASA